jgi:EipB-like
MMSLGLRSLVLGALLLAPVVGLPARADTVALVPHRGIYDIGLKSAQDRSGITSAQGRMVIEVQGGSCEGWTVDFRMVNQFMTESGTSRLLDVRSSSWESPDGKEMRYNERQFVDNALQDESILSAAVGTEGKPGKGKMTKPSEKEFEIPPGTIFAVAHQIKLVQLARKGETRDASIVFDGSDGEKSMEVISFFGGPNKADKVEAAKALSNMTSWPVSISYFPRKDGKSEETPEYQVSMRLFENGVSGDLVLDYGEFVLNAHLAKLDLLEPPKCK